jgi:hypothetical protein
MLLDPELSPFTQAIPFIQSAVRRIRHSGTATHLIALSDSFFALQDLLTCAERSALPLDLLPEPLLSNYQAHLRTLSFELRRARYLLSQERARLQAQFNPIQ